MKFRALALLLLTGCAADNYLRPAMAAPDRDSFMLCSGGLLRDSVRFAFREGRVVHGMPRYLITSLYGDPDLVIQCPRQSLLCNEIHVYQTNDTHTVGSVSILGDTAVQVTGQLLKPQRF